MNASAVMKLILLKIFQLFPIKNNKIVFTSFFGRRISDNPRYIAEELEGNGDLDIVWLIDSKNDYDSMSRIVKLRSPRAVYDLATAKVWVDNSRKPIWMRKRHDQFYIQTWHGGVALKSIEADAEDKLLPQYVKKAKNDSNMADLFISDCKWCTSLYKTSFWYSGKILECGSPRSDIFFQDHENIRKKVLQYYSLSEETKLVLYAPTFRNDGRLDYYSMDYDLLIKTVASRFGGAWKLLIRLHPNLNALQDAISYNENVLNGSAYNEMNELLIASEILITDYSSSMFDGFRIGKTVFLYAPDLDEYQSKERSLYFDVHDLPSSFAESQKQLLDNINSFDAESYRNRTKLFVDEIGYFGDGTSSKKIADIITEIVNNSNSKRSKLV